MENKSKKVSDSTWVFLVSASSFLLSELVAEFFPALYSWINLFKLVGLTSFVIGLYIFFKEKHKTTG